MKIFCLACVSKDFTKHEQSEIFFKWYVYEFSIDHSSITKEDILNIHQYLMVKNNTK